KEALRFVDGMRAGGGTMMGLGVQEALTPSVEQSRHRYVFFMTDGYIGNEAAITSGARALISTLQARGRRAKLFAFGTGSSTNRHLLEGLAKAGRGVAVYASTRQDPIEAVNTFYRYVDHPVLTDIEIDWGNLSVDEVYPRVLPDLFASRPMIITGR